MCAFVISALFIRPKKSVEFPITMLKELGRVGRKYFFFFCVFYLPGRAVGGIVVISIRLLVVE